MFSQFIETIVKDSSLATEYKAFIICSLSGGLRVEEALALDQTSFMNIDGALYFESKVLKKRRADKRWCRVHPAGQQLVETFIKARIGKLFDFTQNTALVRAKKVFRVAGICSHSFRHSAVSYLLFTEQLTIATTAKLIHINSKIVDTYAHLDERLALSKLFQP